MSQAPAELWLRSTDTGRWYHHLLKPPEPNAVRYVRADLYEALQGRLAVVRSWNEAPCLEPIDAELEAHKARLAGAVRDQSEANHERMQRGQNQQLSGEQQWLSNQSRVSRK